MLELHGCNKVIGGKRYPSWVDPCDAESRLDGCYRNVLGRLAPVLKEPIGMCDGERVGCHKIVGGKLAPILQFPEYATLQELIDNCCEESSSSSSSESSSESSSSESSSESSSSESSSESSSSESSSESSSSESSSESSSSESSKSGESSDSKGSGESSEEIPPCLCACACKFKKYPTKIEMSLSNIEIWRNDGSGVCSFYNNTSPGGAELLKSFSGDEEAMCLYQRLYGSGGTSTTWYLNTSAERTIIYMYSAGNSKTLFYAEVEGCKFGGVFDNQLVACTSSAPWAYYFTGGSAILTPVFE